MSLESQIAAAVQQSMQDAARAASSRWKDQPALYGTAALTGIRQSGCTSMAEAELTFETHAQQIPLGQRDAYGVSARTAAAHPSQRLPRTSPQSLMQKIERTLDDSFRDAFASHAGDI